jgi:hypothetical protein
MFNLVNKDKNIYSYYVTIIYNNKLIGTFNMEIEFYNYHYNHMSFLLYLKKYYNIYNSDIHDIITNKTYINDDYIKYVSHLYLTKDIYNKAIKYYNKKKRKEKIKSIL